MADAHDVAAYVLQKCGPITTMKLQKLCYYSQAYHLAWLHRPLFSEQIEAWTNGPVIRDLWNSHRGQFMVDSLNRGQASALDPNEQRVIDAVITAFGGLTGKQLSDRTHRESPWKDKYDGDDALPNGIITPQELERYYAHPAM